MTTSQDPRKTLTATMTAKPSKLSSQYECWPLLPEGPGHDYCCLTNGICKLVGLFSGLSKARPSTFLLPLNSMPFVLLMIGPGLSTTFVCILPLAASHREGEKQVSVLPYVPLIVALALLVVPFPLLLVWPQMRIVYILLTLVFNFACLVVVVWMLFRGLHHLSRDEKRITQMIGVGSLFLLLPLALSISIIGTNNIVQPDLVRLLSVPLTALPIIYTYILFRPRLVGITSLLSRQAMRVLLWLLLASLFVFPIVILLRFVSANVTNGTEMRVYIFAILLVLSLWLFPLVWSKVRDMGDSVFYRDFYLRKTCS